MGKPRERAGNGALHALQPAATGPAAAKAARGLFLFQQAGFQAARGVMATIILIIHLMLAVALVATVLLQRSEGLCLLHI